MRIGIDVDGVISCFFDAYENLTVEVAGVDLFPARYPEALPKVWNWPESFGYSAETMREVWRRIRTSDTFWKSCNPLPGAENFLRNLYYKEAEVYFITDRPGATSQYQTAVWLEKYGFSYAAVILSGKHASKGDIAACLKLDVYIDDKTENVQDVLAKSPSTKMIMPIYPYNEDVPGSVRVNNLEEALEECR